MKNILLLFGLFCVQQGLALNPTHFTINRISAPYFIVDGNSPATLTKAYVGFEVINNSGSATTYTGLKLTIQSISTSVVGQNYSIASPASGVINIGTLAPGQSKVCYYFINYPAHTTAQGTFNLLLSDTTATGKSQSFMIYNRSSISANAGGTATQSFTNQDLIGGLITDDVTYVVGNSQNGDENDFQVSVAAGFDPTKMTLLSTQVITSSIPNINAGSTDSLYFISGNGSNGASVTVRWTFRITGYGFTSYILPCAGATSGASNYKYALNTALGAGTPVTISAGANPLTITKSSDKTLYMVNSTAIFTVTLCNPGAYPVTIDKITDQLPAGFTYVALDGSSQVTAANSTSIPAAGATGTITFEGGVTSGGNTSYYIPAGGCFILKYSATAPGVSASNLSTTAKDYIGTTEVGSASNTVNVSTTLPLTLLSFNGTRKNDVVNLTWVTAQEKQISGFDVERNDGVHGYISVGSLSAAGGNNEQTYHFTDASAPEGHLLYRLRINSRNDAMQYGPVLSFSQGTDPVSLSPYPNPFTGEIRFSLSLNKPGPVRVILTDQAGRDVATTSLNATAGVQAIRMGSLERLSAGVYLLRVIQGDEQIAAKTILKR